MREKKNQTKIFDQQDLNAKRSTFDLSYPNKLTCNFNKIVPTAFVKVMAGDSMHIKTNFFSRYLMMQAPVFSEYTMKFNNFFVGLNQLWGGFEQLLGQGDSQSAQYLLPGSTEILTEMEIPHITTQELCKLFARKIFTTATLPEISVRGNNPFYTCKTLTIRPIFRKYYRMFIAPVLVQPLQNTQAWDYTQSKYDDGFSPFGKELDVKYLYIIGSRKDSEYWDSLVKLGAVVETDCQFEADGITEKDNSDTYRRIVTFFESEESQNYVLVPEGFNVKLYAGGKTPLFYPQTSFFPSESMDIQSDLRQDVSIASNTHLSWKGRRYTRYCPKAKPVNLPLREDPHRLLYGHENTVVTPVGYLLNLLPSETMTSTSVYNVLSYQDIFDRTLGQNLIAQILGAGSLSDYLGMNFSHSLIRQPFAVANTILGNSFGVNSANAKAVIGTYNENSEKIEIGIVNNVKINILKYIGYHKCWSDYIRDNRYELRPLYADPYKSPLLRSLADGTYFSGLFAYVIDEFECFDNMTGYMFNGTEGSYAYSRLGWGTSEDEVYSQLGARIKPSSMYHLLELLTIRERRVVHDFYTMVTPTSQYGDEAVANIQTDEQGNQGVSVLLLRTATRLQKFLERSNFVGSDYIKQMLAHYGVKPSSCNHCETKYLGGQRFTPTISPVTVTSTSSETQTTGEQGAQMYCSGTLNEVDLDSNEYGYFYQFLTYQNDFFTVSGQLRDEITYFDFPHPEFADLGPQPLALHEVVNKDTTVTKGQQRDPQSLFGYVPRFAPWKVSLSQVHGDFKKSLSYWVSTRQLDSDLLNGSFGYGQVDNVPQVGKNFLYENADYQAFIYTGEDFDHILADLDQQISCSRLLPMLPSPSVL